MSTLTQTTTTFTTYQISDTCYYHQHPIATLSLSLSSVEHGRNCAHDQTAVLDHGAPRYDSSGLVELYLQNRLRWVLQSLPFHNMVRGWPTSLDEFSGRAVSEAQWLALRESNSE